MRRFVVAAAIPTLAVWACSRFEAEGGGAEPMPDASIDRAIADGAGRDTASPNDPLASITYDRKDDFERDPSLTGGPLAWTAEAPNTTVDDVIGVGTCDDSHCTPSHSVTITHDETGAGYLATTLGSSTRSLRFDFAMKISRVNPDGGRVRLVSIELADNRFIFVQVVGDQLELGDKMSGTEDSTVDLGSIAFDAWSRYRLYVDLDERVAALARDGTRFPTSLTIRPEAVTTMVRARLGITLVAENFFQLEYDDVGVRELPKP